MTDTARLRDLKDKRAEIARVLATLEDAKVLGGADNGPRIRETLEQLADLDAQIAAEEARQA